MKTHQSVAYWPAGTISSYPNIDGENVSTDDHESEEEARAVCSLLTLHGFGGDHEVFPLRTEVKEL